MKPFHEGRRRLGPVLLGCLATAGFTAGCTGDIGDADENGGEEGSGTTGPTLIPEDGTYQPFRGADASYAKSRIWQLTPAQYQAAVQAAIGAPVDLASIQ